MTNAFIARLRKSTIVARISRNLAWIMLSQGAVAVFGLVALAVTARAIGAEGLGVLALVEAFARIVARLTHIEPWQAAIRHGSVAMEEGDNERFSRVIGLSVLVDTAGGLLSAIVVLALAGVLAPKFGLEDGQTQYLLFASIAVLISFRSTGVALLRLYDRFDLMAKVDTATALARMALSLLVYALGGGLGHFVAVFIIFSVLDGLANFLFAWREMRRRGHGPKYLPVRDSLAMNPGFVRLMWNANLSVIWRQSTERLDTIVLATLLPPVAIGYYHIARRIGEAAMRLGRPLKQTLYPELTRLAARGDWRRFGRLTWITTLGFAVVLVIVLPPILWQIEPILIQLFGSTFAPAAPVVFVQSIAVSITLIGVILGPAMLSMDRDVALVRVSAASAILFFALLVPAVTLWGVVGAAVARVVANTLRIATFAWVVRQALRGAGGGVSPAIADDGG